MSSTAIHAGPLPHAAPDDEHHVGPLPQAAADSEHHPGVLPAAVQPRRQRKSWREKRWERRRRRRFFEEVMGWILVPIIVIATIWAVKAGLGAMGTNFTALIAGIKTALSGGKGG